MPLFKNKAWIYLLLVVATGYCFIEARGEGDLLIFLWAGGDLGHENIFVKGYIHGDYHYYYSVLFALLMKPFYTLPFYWVKALWLLLNMACFIHLFSLLAASRFIQALPDKERRIFLLIVFLFSLRFLHENLHASQITILILWCAVYGLVLIHRDRQIGGSALLALGINIKLLPLVLLPYLLYRGFFRSFFMTLMFWAAYLFIPSIIVGHEYNMSLLGSWLKLMNPTNKQHVLDVDERSFHSLTTLLSTLLVKDVPDYYALPLRRNIMDVSLETLSLVILLARLALVGFTLYFLKLRTFTKRVADLPAFAEVCYILLLIPLIFPHQQHYAFLFQVPAFALALFFVMKEKSSLPERLKGWMTAGLCFVYLCSNLKIVLGAFNRYYEHYKILTYGALLLIVLLALARAYMNKIRVRDSSAG